MPQFRTMLASVAAAGLVLAPVAAEAGTRASSSPVAADTRDAAPIAQHNKLAKANVLWLLLLVAVLGAVLAAGGGSGRSRG